MQTYDQVPLPVERAAIPRRRDIVDGIATWVRSRPLADLVARFGGRIPDSPVREQLEYLDAISLQHWDFRKGKERFDAIDADFDAETDELIVEASAALGLAAREVPAADSYSHLIVLGGGARTCVIRAEFAAGLVGTGIEVQTAAGLGSFRPTTATEKDHARRLGCDPCGSEFAAMDLALRRAFGLPDGSGVDEMHGGPGDPAGEMPRDAWLIRRYANGSAGFAVDVLAAPSSEPARRRANTADTLVFWGDRIAHLDPSDRVLAVTSNVHVPFQHFDAVRTLGLRFGCAVDTVGVDMMDATQEWMRFSWDTSQVLQEVRSAIWSLSLLAAETAAVTGAARTGF